MKTAPVLSHTPFAELMSHPEKLEAALSAARRENDAFAATRKFVHSRRATHRAACHSADPPRPELREVEFRLKAPSARSVMLAGNFTDWGKFPLDMVKNEDGVWSIFVPLLPGIYAYRFIVDGEWRDDPRSDLYAPNPFGSADAVVTIT
jgi:1,4-alpha-glucan branching enzyme